MIFRTLSLSILISLLSISSSYSQCPIGTIELKSQTEVVDFITQYNTCNTIIGTLRISGNNITDLSGLSFLKYIEGNFEIAFNNSLISLNGLDNLSRFEGNLIILFNEKLTDCSAICKLVNNSDLTNNIHIFGNPAECSSLSDITTECVEVQCPTENIVINTQAQIDSFAQTYPNCTELNVNISIEKNLFSDTSISNLNGLRQISKINKSLNIEFTEINNLTGLDNLTYIGGIFTLSDNANLINLQGLDNLTTIEKDLYILGNHKLKDISAINQLTKIGGELLLFYNDILSNLNGLEQLASIGKSLTLWSNSSLQNIEGLIGLNSIGKEILIIDNPALTNCETAILCTHLLEEKEATINNNGIGCSTSEEILLACNSNDPCITNPSIVDFEFSVIDNTNTVNLTVDTSNAPNITNFIWTFGDGTSSSGLLPTTTYTYESAGTYTITLETIGDCNTPLVAKEIIVGQESPENTIDACTDDLDNDLDGLIDADDSDCICILESDGDDCCIDFKVNVQVTNDVNSQGNGSVILFPIGGSSDLGTYNIELMGENTSFIDFRIDGEGLLIDSLSESIYEFLITDLSTGCTYTSIIEILNIDCSDFSVRVEELENTCTNITYTAQLKNGTPPFQYNWTADSTNTDSFYIANTETHIGNQTLTVTDANGCISSQVFTVTPSTELAAIFTYELTADSIILNNQSVGNIIETQWTFNTPTPPVKNRIALPPIGNYRICLLVSNECNLQRSICQTISIIDPNPICPDGSVVLNSDVEILDFIQTYPNCTEIVGDLLIRSNLVNSLAPLVQLTTIEGTLFIDNTSISNLKGIENITTIGNLTINQNNRIVDLSGFTQLTTIKERVIIMENHGLQRVNGFNNLTSTSTELNFYDNGSLSIIDGFARLPAIEKLSISKNFSLTDISGIGQFNTLGSSIQIENNPLLATCNVLSICQHLVNEKQSNINNNATDCNSVEAVITSCTPLEDNDQDGVLSDVDPDDNDSCIPNTTDITCNPSTEMDVLTMFKKYPFLNIFVDTTDCTNEKITLYLSGGYPYIYVEKEKSNILYNANGTKYCTDGEDLECTKAYAIDEIIEVWSCTADYKNTEIANAKKTNIVSKDDFLVHPNPSNGLFYVDLTKFSFQSEVIIIRNTRGQILLSKKASTGVIELDLTSQAAGVYFVQVQSREGIMTKRLVIR